MDKPALPPTPWRYRPYEFDDWGIVRSADDWVVGQPSFSRFEEHELDAYRKAGIDPYEDVARLWAAAPDLAKAAEPIVSISFIDDEDWTDNDYIEVPVHELRALKAAYRKAIGETS